MLNKLLHCIIVLYDLELFSTKISRKDWKGWLILWIIYSFTHKVYSGPMLWFLCFCPGVPFSRSLTFHITMIIPFSGRILHHNLYYSIYLRFLVRIGMSTSTLISFHHILSERNCSIDPISAFIGKQRPQFIAGYIASELKYFLAFLEAGCDHMIASQ